MVFVLELDTILVSERTSRETRVPGNHKQKRCSAKHTKLNALLDVQ